MLIERGPRIAGVALHPGYKAEIMNRLPLRANPPWGKESKVNHMVIRVLVDRRLLRRARPVRAGATLLGRGCDATAALEMAGGIV
jgi:hypothetical protein